MIEPLFSLAKTYLIDLVVKNEEVQKFPKDFVTASMKWIRSWFLVDDPVTETIIQSDKPAVVKEAVLEAKLIELLKNPKFEQELKAQLEAFNDHRNHIKNVLDQADIEVVGSVHIGDTGTIHDTTLHEKNVVKGGSIKAGKDFRLGDEYSK